jgi:prevent-host-death family protein
LTNSKNWRKIKTSEAAHMASTQVNLYEAKTQLSSLVDRASKGEEIVIAKAGKPMAKLSPIAVKKTELEPPPLPFGQNLLGIEFLSDDWEEDIPLEWFEDEEENKLLFPGGAK